MQKKVIGQFFKKGWNATHAYSCFYFQFDISSSKYKTNYFSAKTEKMADLNDPNVYIIESILDRRTNKGKVEYLISWQGKIFLLHNKLGKYTFMFF